MNPLLRNPGRLLGWLLVLVSFAALCAPNFIRIQPHTELGDLEYVEAGVYGLCFWLLWFALFRRLWLPLAGAALFLLWWAPALFVRASFHVPITPTFLGMAMDTNAAELRNFLSVYGLKTLLPLLLSFGWLAAAALVARRQGLAWSHRSRVWILVLMPALALLLYTQFERQEPTGIDARKDPFRLEPMRFWTDKWRRIYPLDLPLSARQLWQSAVRVSELRGSLAEYRFDAVQHTDAPLDVVVMVVGESSRADRWGLFGYARPTTPKLSSQPNLIPFSDMVALSIATRSSVPSIVARHPFMQPTGQVAQRNVEPSIARAFAEVGYKTFWLSNQATSGFFESPIAFYAADAQTTTFFNPSSYSARGAFDDVLIPPLKTALQTPGKVFVVLHTMGSHFNYAFRYPPEFDRFKPSTSGAEVNPGASWDLGERTNNAYDNSILYTDHVLSGVIDAVQQTGRRAVVAYVSDHGEDVYEKGCVSPGISRMSRHAYEVPGFIWFSPTAAESHRPQFEALQARSHDRLRSNVFFQTLVDLADIQLRNGERGPSLLDRATPAPAERLVVVQDEWVDFDAARQVDACVIRSH